MWTRESPRAHEANFFGRLRLIHRVFRALTNFRVKFDEIVILWVCDTFHSGTACFDMFGVSFLNF